jgi:hypothetical protein
VIRSRHASGVIGHEELQMSPHVQRNAAQRSAAHGWYVLT